MELNYKLIILHRTRKNNAKIDMKSQKTPKSPSNLEKKNDVGGVML